MARPYLLTDGIYDYTYYAIERPVTPSGGERTDVMLVQFLIAKYFLYQTGPTKAEFLKVFAAATAGGKRWDDGFYGENTRKGVLLFETTAYAPVKEGVFRPGTFRSIDGEYTGSLAKIDKLNWVFDRYFSSNFHDKSRNIRTTANPVLGRKLQVEM